MAQEIHDPAVDRMLRNASVSQIPMNQEQMQSAQLREHIAQQEFNREQALRNEQYQRELNDRQFTVAKLTAALNVVCNPEFNTLCKADAHAVKEDLDLARAARRASLNVIASALGTS